MLEFQIPSFLPDGSVLLMDKTFLDRLHHGDATVGWIGDERLGVYIGDESRIELWRWCEDGEPRLIMRSKPGHRLLDVETLRFLADHDSQSRRKFSGAEILAHNIKTYERHQKDAQDMQEAVADRLHFALTKDVGAHLTGLSKRLFAMGSYKKESA